MSDDRLKRLTLAEVEAAIDPDPQTEKRRANLRIRNAVKQFVDRTPPLFRDATLESFARGGGPKPILDKARRYIEEFPEVGLFKLMQGPPGTGKTHICYAIGREIAAKGYVVVLVKLSHLVMDLRATWKGGGESESFVLARYRDPTLLIIDEISQRMIHGDGRAHLYQVINHRIEYCRPTIITTNEDESELHELLGPALLDRLSLGGKWEFKGKSYRPKMGGIE